MLASSEPGVGDALGPVWGRAVLVEVANIGRFRLEHHDGIEEPILGPTVADHLDSGKIGSIEAMNAVKNLDHEPTIIAAHARHERDPSIEEVPKIVRFVAPSWQLLEPFEQRRIGQDVQVGASESRSDPLSIGIEVADCPEIDGLTADHHSRGLAGADQAVVVRISGVRFGHGRH